MMTVTKTYNMKNKIIIIFTILVFNIVGAQQIADVSEYTNQSNLVPNMYYKDLNNIYSNYIGTWENVSGIETFRVILWKVEKVKYPRGVNVYMDEIHGKFMMIQNAGQSNETILYRSEKEFLNTGSYWSDIIRFIAVDNNIFGGVIMDNCMAIEGDSRLRSFSFRMDYTTMPVTAHWKVKNLPESPPSDPPILIPTDLILTKVN
jgi:hypothetical protein